jgi:hypothetical protein
VSESANSKNLIVSAPIVFAGLAVVFVFEQFDLESVSFD